VLSALGQQIAPHLLAQNIQRVELLVVELGSAAHAGFGDLAEAIPNDSVVRRLAGRHREWPSFGKGPSDDSSPA
jgi:hypothetical protein